MEIQVNDKIISIPTNFTVSRLLKHLDSFKSVAIFVNGKQLMMAEYETFQLHKGDKVKIIKPLGGG